MPPYPRPVSSRTPISPCQVLVGGRTATVFHVFELEIELPKFALYAAVERGSLPEPQGSVTFRCVAGSRRGGGSGRGGGSDEDRTGQEVWQQQLSAGTQAPGEGFKAGHEKRDMVHGLAGRVAGTPAGCNRKERAVLCQRQETDVRKARPV